MMRLAGQLLFLTLLALTSNQCAGSRSFYGAHGDFLAKDQIMLVRESPQTMGYARLMMHSKEFPDLGLFFHQRGVPDFVAETEASNRRYLIFYYVKDRQAFACRSMGRRSNAVEFSGPYPITEREFHVLSDFRKQSETTVL